MTWAWPKPLSLATRLTLWYGLVAFLLLSSFAFVQYRLLSNDLASEDDELLLQTLGAASRGAIPVDLIAAPGSLPGPYVRLLDQKCTLLVGRSDSRRPPLKCPGPVDSFPIFSTWKSSEGRVWRSAFLKLQSAKEIPTLPVEARWAEAALDRWTDFAILESYRRKLFAMLPIAILLSGAIGYLIAKRGLAPLRSISRSLAGIDVRSLSHSFDIQGGNSVPPEIERLLHSLDEMRQKLNNRFDVLERFSGELAHEFRTPIHVLRQQAEIALTHPRTTSEYREVLASSLEEYERLNRMIADTLFLARVEDPAIHVSMGKLDVAEELQAVAGFLDALAAEKKVRLSLDVSRELNVKADRTMFRRALVNIIANAIAHTPAGGDVRIVGIWDGTAVKMTISDTGAGITKSDLPHVFERYFRGHQRLNGEGSGLGLSIVQGIMTLHRGLVQIESSVDQGTVVSVTFPG